MNKSWFDPETGLLNLDEYVAEIPSYQTIMADGRVTREEVAEHAGRVVELLRQLDDVLPPEIKSLTTEALCQLAVLYAIQRYQALNPVHHRR